MAREAGIFVDGRSVGDVDIVILEEGEFGEPPPASYSTTPFDKMFDQGIPGDRQPTFRGSGHGVGGHGIGPGARHHAATHKLPVFRGHGLKGKHKHIQPHYIKPDGSRAPPPYKGGPTFRQHLTPRGAAPAAKPEKFTTADVQAAVKGEGNLKGSAYLKKEREWIKKELDADPALKRYLGGVIAHEQSPGERAKVFESMANRLNMFRQHGQPNLTLREYLSRTGSHQFYGPIKRGEIVPQSSESLDRDINEVLEGSNYVRGMTDQGSRGDPNFGRGETIMSHGEGYNEFGHPGAHAYRMEQQRRVMQGGAVTGRPEGVTRLGGDPNYQPSVGATATDADQRNRPLHEQGTFTFQGETYRWGSGGIHYGSIPYGHYRIGAEPVGPVGQRMGALGMTGTQTGIPDPQFGRSRQGIELHPGHGDLLTEGCIAVAGDKWPQLKAAVLESEARGQPVYFHHTPQGMTVDTNPGGDRLTPRSQRASPNTPTPSPNTAIGDREKHSSLRGLVHLAGDVPTPDTRDPAPASGGGGGAMAGAPFNLGTRSTERFGIEERDVGWATRTMPEQLYAIRREKFAAELAKPEVRDLLLASTMAEQSNQPHLAQQAYIESVMNRAASRGETLEATLKNPAYYPQRTKGMLKDKVSAVDQMRLMGALGEVMLGSNVSRMATGNASKDVGFGKTGIHTSGRNLGFGPQSALDTKQRFAGLSSKDYTGDPKYVPPPAEYWRRNQRNINRTRPPWGREDLGPPIIPGQRSDTPDPRGIVDEEGLPIFNKII